VFVGESRRKVLAALTGAFDEVRTGETARVAVLASQPGWGKTRIVQELYARLSARQAYWPPAIVDAAQSTTLSALSRARKAVYPTRVDVPEGAEMEWMWWGILCHQRSDGHLAQAMFDDAAQLYAHAPALMRDPLDDVGGRAFDVGSATIGVLGLLGLAVAPPVGTVIAVAGATREGWKNAVVVRRLLEWWSANRGVDPQRAIEADSPSHHEDRIERLVDGLGRLTRARPLIVVVDDAQFADDTLLRVLDGLVRTAGSRVLVVATAWPSHLDAPEASLPFARWARSIAAEHPERFARFDLEALGADEIAALVQAELPAAAGAAGRLFELYGTNLLALHGVLRLPRVRALAERGDLAAGAPAQLPRDVEAIFAEHWAGLPDAVQHVLALAAQPGIRYLPEVVAAASGMGAAARERLAEGVSPYAWAREIDGSLHSFVDPVLQRIAKGRGDELLVDEEFAAWRAAIVAAAEQDETLDLSPLARSELYEQHVALVRDGAAPADIVAARSAYALAETRAARYDYAGAIELATLALGWTGLPAEHPEMLIARKEIAGWVGEAGRTEDALRQLDEVLGAADRVHGLDAPEAISARGLRGVLLRDAGRVNEAVVMFDALLSDAVRLYGPSDPETLRARANVAAALSSAGDDEEAVRRFRELLPDMLAVLGPDDPDTLALQSRLAFAAGGADEAVRQLEHVLAARLRLGGPDHPDTLTARQDLAMWLEAAGRMDEALAAYETVLAARRRLLGAGHPETLRSRTDLARAWGAIGRPEAAVRELEALVAEWRRRFGPDHPWSLDARQFLADGMVAAGREEDAMRVLQALLPDRRRVLGPDHPDTVALRVELAERLAEDGRAAEAAAEYEAVLIAQRRSLGVDHPVTLASWQQAAWWIGEAGHEHEAARQFELIAAACERVLGPEDRETLRARFLLAHWLVRDGRLEAGGIVLLPLLKDMDRVLGRDDPDTLAALELSEAWMEIVEAAEPILRENDDAHPDA
jgi:tetratricopeptide (TPR) repeat protein